MIWFLLPLFRAMRFPLRSLTEDHCSNHIDQFIKLRSRNNRKWSRDSQSGKGGTHWKQAPRELSGAEQVFLHWRAVVVAQLSCSRDSSSSNFTWVLRYIKYTSSKLLRSGSTQSECVAQHPNRAPFPTHPSWIACYLDGWCHSTWLLLPWRLPSFVFSTYISWPVLPL